KAASEASGHRPHPATSSCPRRTASGSRRPDRCRLSLPPTISTMRRRHDPFLKRLYRAGIRDALTLFFPDLAVRIDWDQWQWLDKEIIIRGSWPRSLVADLVGMTRDVKGRYLRVLVHP